MSWHARHSTYGWKVLPGSTSENWIVQAVAVATAVVVLAAVALAVAIVVGVAVAEAAAVAVAVAVRLGGLVGVGVRDVGGGVCVGDAGGVAEGVTIGVGVEVSVLGSILVTNASLLPARAVWNGVPASGKLSD